MTAAVIRLPSKPWTHPCPRFFLGRSMKFCGVCGFAKLLHPKLIACASCGEEFEAVDGETHGFSMCSEHENRRAV